MHWTCSVLPLLNALTVQHTNMEKLALHSRRNWPLYHKYTEPRAPNGKRALDVHDAHVGHIRYWYLRMLLVKHLVFEIWLVFLIILVEPRNYCFGAICCLCLCVRPRQYPHMGKIVVLIIKQQVDVIV